ncbi:MAG: CDP-diacylglycerol--serine O-phosphatidyltransferase [Desulfobulbaceae bacterium]|jgi:CDP-diacylglycerol--serine O-phosphatidyltransferase|nr:CDP-diacylglycerol--serine O-phosphatidyltransferase [Desulfobulbaceae bacterium]
MEMDDQGTEYKQAPRGTVYILPNLITTFSLFSGFYAIVSSINGKFVHAAIAILIASVFDAADGRVARMTGTTSKFGEQYDSLCDLISFGMAPALLSYLWLLQPFGRYGWLAVFLYVAATALRLARFNSQIEETPKGVFVGLPCPAAAAMIATVVIFCNFVCDIRAQYLDIILLLTVYFLSYLMVSGHHYNNFKHISKPNTFQFMVGTILFFIIIATEPQITLFVLFISYILSAPLAGVYRLIRRKKGDISKTKAGL